MAKNARIAIETQENATRKVQESKQISNMLKNGAKSKLLEEDEIIQNHMK